MLRLPPPHLIAAKRSFSQPAATLPDGLQTDPAKIKSLTGLVAAHLDPLLQLAADSQLLLAFRPVEHLATSLIAAGYPTKNFHIKGKSANWGPMAGMIPVDQQWSKLAGQAEAIRKANQQILHCIEAGYAGSTDLLLPRERLDTLIEQGLLERKGSWQSATLMLGAKDPNGQNHTFSAIPTPAGYRIETGGQSLKVLSHPALERPLTADYDLMLVAPRVEDYGPDDQLPVPDISYQRLQQRLAHYGPDKAQALRRTWPDETTFYAAEDPHLGNASLRIRRLIPQINQTLGRTDGLEVVHHNMDASSPAADYRQNYPLTVFLPKPLAGLPRLLLLEDQQALGHLLKAAKDHGYQPCINPLWEQPLQGLRRQSFDDAVSFFSPSSPQRTSPPSD